MENKLERNKTDVVKLIFEKVHTRVVDGLD